MKMRASSIRHHGLPNEDDNICACQGGSEKQPYADLKPENVLIRSYSRCQVKVIDMGSSCFTSDHLSSYVQSRSYRAPEVILGLPYGQKVDIWSLGCILAELLSGAVLLQVCCWPCIAGHSNSIQPMYWSPRQRLYRLQASWHKSLRAVTSKLPVQSASSQSPGSLSGIPMLPSGSHMLALRTCECPAMLGLQALAISNKTGTPAQPCIKNFVYRMTPCKRCWHAWRAFWAHCPRRCVPRDALPTDTTRTLGPSISANPAR